MIDFAADNSTFLGPADFAESFTIDDGSIAGRTVTGIYDGPYKRADLLQGGVESVAPQVTLSTTDADGVAHGTRITRRQTGVDYYVAGVQPDGQGMTVLILSEDEVEQ